MKICHTCHLINENLHFLRYMIDEGDYDKDLIVEYINYNIQLIQNGKA